MEAPAGSRKRPHEGAEEEEEKKLTIVDLPDHVLLQIFGYCNLKTRLQLRVSKKVEQRLFSIPIELESIRLSIAPSNYTLRVNATQTTWDPNDRSMIHLVKGLQRWAHNVYARVITIDLGEAPNGSKEFAIAALCRFNTDKLLMRSGTQFELPRLTFANLIGMANKIRVISIDHVCTTLEAKDLCTLRQMVLTQPDGVILESLSVDVRPGVKEAFAKECLQLIIEEESEPSRTIKYRSEAERPAKFYSTYDSPAHLIHFEANVRTDVFSNCVRFERISDDEREDLLYDVEEIELNRVYGLDEVDEEW